MKGAIMRIHVTWNALVLEVADGGMEGVHMRIKGSFYVAGNCPLTLNVGEKARKLSS